MKKAIVLLALLAIVACGKKTEENSNKDVVVEKTIDKSQNITKEVEQEINKEELVEKDQLIGNAEESEKEKDQLIENMQEVEIKKESSENTQEAKLDGYFIDRSMVTSGVENREPLEEKKVYQVNEKAYMYTEFKNIGDEKVIHHKWYYIGKDEVPEMMADVKLEIKGARWRVWSSKELNITGDWIVEVEDHLGNVIEREKIKVE